MSYRPTYVEINLKNLIHNIKELKKNISKNTKIIGVIKSNAYGHGLIPVAKTLSSEVFMFGVISTDEGISLREKGIKNPIIVLGPLYPFEKNFKDMIQYKLIPVISSVNDLKYLSKTKDRIVKFHLKVDTGMHRIGIPVSGLDSFLNEYKNKNIILDGAYTHLSCAGSDKEYTQYQIKNFNIAINKIRKKFPSVKLFHAANSSATLLYKEAHYNAIRPGLCLYGLPPFENAHKYINLKPVLSWKTKIVFLKKVKKGSRISYCGTFTTKKDSKIATLPTGYADGLPRLLSNKGYALVRNKKVRIVGTITMDMSMIDVTGIDAKIGDEVVLIGTQGSETITADDMAELAQTISYEIVTGIHPRVERVYTGGE